MAVQQQQQLPSWDEDLVPELLGRIAAMCPNPADLARFRSVCRSWRHAVRHHCPHATTLLRLQHLQPWVVLPDGSFLMLSDGEERHLPSAVLPYLGQNNALVFVQPSDGGPHRLSLPEGTAVVGSTDDGCLALCRHDDRRGNGADTFMLHNPFSSSSSSRNSTRPLPGVDAICAKAAALGEWFCVFKVLVRRCSDLVVVISQSRSYPFVLTTTTGNNGAAWTPDRHAPPFMHIIDVAFMGDKLYGITRGEDLFSFHLASSSSVHPSSHHHHGAPPPCVTRCERIIRHPLDLEFYYGGRRVFDDYYAPWSDDEDDGDDISNDDEDYEEVSDDDDDEQQPLISSEDDEEDSCISSEADDEDYSYGDETKNLQVPSNVDVRFDKESSSKEEGVDVYTITIRYLVELESSSPVSSSSSSSDGNGKLIMVRRELQSPDSRPTYTRKVEVFEADMEAGAWVPTNGLGLGSDGAGKSLFVSKCFSKCVSTAAAAAAAKQQHHQLHEDSIYFMDTGEVFDMRTATISPRRWCLHYAHSTWLFPPPLVV